MPGLTDRDLRRIERFVRTPSHRRTPAILTPTGDEGAAPEGAGDRADIADAAE